MGNLGPGTTEINPYQPAGNGSAIGLWLSSGSEAYAQGKTVYPASTAIGIVSNGSTWAKGLVFMHDALVADGNGNMKAIQLPRHGEMQWTFDSSGSRSSFIRCDGTSSGGGMGISFQESYFVIVDAPTETARMFVSNSGTVSSGSALQIGGLSGPTWTTGSAAPSSTQPVGSLYSRVGGAVGATLYVSRGGGTWAAVSGV
jgi:hypothetical protein